MPLLDNVRLLSGKLPTSGTILVFGVVLVLAGAVVACAGDDSGGATRTEEASPGPSVPSGPGLKVCIQAVDVNATATEFAGDPVVEEVGKGLTDVALIDVARHPLWAPAGYADAAPVVDIGCPSSPLPLQTDTKWHFGSPENTMDLPSVDEPSYRVFVFVVDSEQDINRMLGACPREQRRRSTSAGRCMTPHEPAARCQQAST